MKYVLPSSEIRDWWSASTRSPDSQLDAYILREICDVKLNCFEIKKSCYFDSILSKQCTDIVFTDWQSVFSRRLLELQIRWPMACGLQVQVWNITHNTNFRTRQALERRTTSELWVYCFFLESSFRQGSIYGMGCQIWQFLATHSQRNWSEQCYWHGIFTFKEFFMKINGRNSIDNPGIFIQNRHRILPGIDNGDPTP